MKIEFKTIQTTFSCSTAVTPTSSNKLFECLNEKQTKKSVNTDCSLLSVSSGSQSQRKSEKTLSMNDFFAPNSFLVKFFKLKNTDFPSNNNDSLNKTQNNEFSLNTSKPMTNTLIEHTTNEKMLSIQIPKILINETKKSNINKKLRRNKKTDVVYSPQLAASLTKSASTETDPEFENTENILVSSKIEQNINMKIDCSHDFLTFNLKYLKCVFLCLYRI